MIGRFTNTGKFKELIASQEAIRIAFAGALALAGYLIEKHHPFLGLGLILLSVFINGVPIIIGALKGLLEKKVNVDELVSIAIIASLLSGHFLEAAVVSFVMVLGALIEEATSESARKTIKSLISSSPQTATVISNEGETRKPITEIHTGDLLLVKPGEQIPVDAVVTSGISSIDESSITGECIPNEKKPGDEVYAGTLNHNGVLKIKTTKTGQDTTLGKVIQLVTEAEKHKPESISLINRYAQWFTPFILLCAGITLLFTQDIDRAITVLIVGCPCALILAAPTAIVAAIGRAAKEGILVKGGNYLEKAGKVTTILFDKTGTLTEGNPKVDKIISASKDIDKNYILEQAACVEQNSTHPLAKAIIKAAHYARIAVTTAENILTEIGLGARGCVKGCTIAIGSPYISGGSASLPSNLQKPLQTIKNTGATPLVVYKDEMPMGIISVSDHLRSQAKATIQQLKKLNIHETGILSGDHEQSVRLIASETGITNAYSHLKPKDKLLKIEEKQLSGETVMYVGDGINDAPALAVSDIGVAMAKKGTEVALETADIALMHDDIAKLPFLIKLSRRTVLIIKLNIAFGLAFNLAAIIASGSGLLSPIMGAITHNIGSVLVVLSSASIGLLHNKS